MADATPELLDSKFATKADIVALKGDIALLRTEMAALEQRVMTFIDTMTLRLTGAHGRADRGRRCRPRPDHQTLADSGGAAAGRVGARLRPAAGRATYKRMKAVMRAADRVGTRVGRTANYVGTRVGKTANRVGARVGEWATNGTGGIVAATFLQAFDWAYGRAIDGLPGFDGAAELADKFAARHGSPDAAIKALILSQTGLAGSAGFLTGIGGFVSLPVAIPANLASALYIQVRMIAAIAQLRGYDIRTPEVRGLVLACLTGSKAADTLKNAGARLGVRVTRDVAGWVSPALLKKAERVAGVSATALAGAGNAAKMSRVVPVVGGVVAGGVDAAMTQLLGRAADRVFRPKPAIEPPATAVPPPAKPVLTHSKSG
jgi:uncharacterized protein (DUF697 family)